MKNGVIRERFLELADGDPQSCRELVELYLSKTAEQLRELKAAIANRSAADVSLIAHSMAGASLMVGIQSVVPPLRALEQGGETDDLSRAEPAYDALMKEFKVIRASLEA